MTGTETAEQISSGYGNSIILRRWIGCWIDMAVLLLFFFAPDGILGNALYQKTLIIWAGLAIAYFPVLEGRFGWSLGKLVAGTRIVNASGESPGFLAALLRTLTRVIEVNPLLVGGLPAGIIVLVSKKHQRLGDMLADTFVLKKEDLPRVRNGVAA